MGAPSEGWVETRRERINSTAVRRGLRLGITLPLSLGVLVALGYNTAGFSCAFALICLETIAEFRGTRRNRVKANLYTGAAGAATLLLGGACAGLFGVQIVVAVALGFLVTLVGVWRGFTTSASTPILLPYFLAATTVTNTHTLISMLAGWTVGVAVSLVANRWLFVSRTDNGGATLHAVADLIEEEANSTRGLFEGGGEKELAAVDRRWNTLNGLLRGQLRRPGVMFREERTIAALVEEAGRVRLGLRTIFRTGGVGQTRADQQLAEVVEKSLRKAANACRTRNSSTVVGALETARETHWNTVAQHTEALLADGDGDGAYERCSEAFTVRLLSVETLSVGADTDNLSTPQHSSRLHMHGANLPGAINTFGPWTTLKTQLHFRAPWFRNSARLSLALALALSVAELSGVERGYWVVLATLSVLRLDRRGSFEGAWSALRGLVVGFVLGSILFAVVSPRPALAWVSLVLVLGVAGYVSGGKKRWISQAAFTVTLMNMVAISTPDRADLGGVRIVDVLLGLAVAIIVSSLIMVRGQAGAVTSAISVATGATAALLCDAVDSVCANLSEHYPDVTIRNNVGQLARADETVDLALAQGGETDAERTLWIRLVAVLEQTTYVGTLLAEDACQQQSCLASLAALF